MANNSKKFWNKVWSIEDDRFYDFFHTISAIMPDEEATVLDIGCGTGTLLRFLKEQKPNLILKGTDHSEVAIKKLRASGIKGKVEKLPKITGKYDIIVATEVLEHIKNDTKLLENISKHCDTFVGTVPNNCLSPEECSEHERVYTAETLKQKAKQFFNKVNIISLGRYLLIIASK